MTIEVHPRYSKEEFARRGDEAYDQLVRPTVQPGDEGKFVVIDIETGDFELDDDELDAARRLAIRRPNAQVWLTRAGSEAACACSARARPPQRQP